MNPLPTFLRGMAMGAADLVPGVSGGTMALVLGIYQRFIAALAGLTLHMVRPAYWSGQTRARIEQHDLGFLSLLALGIATSVLAGAAIMHALLERYPIVMASMFFGLIVASLPAPGQHMRRDSWGMAMVLLGAGIAWLAAGQTEAAGAGLWFVPVAACIAILAMMLPGVSGAALLLLLGMYGATVAAVNEWQWLYLGLFGLGAAAGLLIGSRGIQALLRAAPASTMALMVGLMVGSLRRVWPYRSEGFAAGHTYTPTGGEWILGALGLAAGLLLGAIALQLPHRAKRFKSNEQ